MKRKRTAVTVVAICLCAMFFCTTRAQAEVNPIGIQSKISPSIYQKRCNPHILRQKEILYFGLEGERYPQIEK